MSIYKSQKRKIYLINFFKELAFTKVKKMRGINWLLLSPGIWISPSRDSTGSIHKLRERERERERERKVEIDR